METTKFQRQYNQKIYHAHEEDAPLSPLEWLWVIPLIFLVPLALIGMGLLYLAPKGVKDRFGRWMAD